MARPSQSMITIETRKEPDNSTRYGYNDRKRGPVKTFKRKDFARWQTIENLPDIALCKAIQEVEAGLIDANLGGCLYKMRVARPGAGKSAGYRTLLSAQIGERYIFLHGFGKNDKPNITHNEKKALQYAGKAFLGLSTESVLKALQIGVLVKVKCDVKNY